MHLIICGFYHSHLNDEIHSEKIKISNHATIFQAEVVAIKYAIQHVNNYMKNKKISIMSDSKSALETIVSSTEERKVILEI